MKAMKGYLTSSRLRSAILTGVPPNSPSIFCNPLMRQLQESVDQPEFVHHLQCRGMHGVAAEITEEIGVLLQHHDLDAGAAKQIAEHHAGRAAADDATADIDRCA